MGKDVVETVSQILVSDTRPRVAERSATFETAAHEFSHRCESAVPGVTVLENEFLTRRTSIVVDPETGATGREKKVLLYAGTDEWTRPDHFASAYMGKHYDHGHTEILSMGMESLFAGTHGGADRRELTRCRSRDEELHPGGAGHRGAVIGPAAGYEANTLSVPLAEGRPTRRPAGITCRPSFTVKVHQLWPSHRTLTGLQQESGHLKFAGGGRVSHFGRVPRPSMSVRCMFA